MTSADWLASLTLIETVGAASNFSLETELIFRKRRNMYVVEVCRTVREPNCLRTFRKKLEFAKFELFS
jgi:hypothetical protein